MFLIQRAEVPSETTTPNHVLESDQTVILHVVTKIVHTLTSDSTTRDGEGENRSFRCRGGEAQAPEAPNVSMPFAYLGGNTCSGLGVALCNVLFV